MLCYDAGTYGAIAYGETYCPASAGYNTSEDLPIDCGNDTYFDAAPATGSYLANYWNTGTPENPYLAVMPSQSAGAATNAATSVDQTSAILQGSVTPNGDYAFYQFEYGTDTSYGSKSPATLSVLERSDGTAAFGSSPVGVSRQITGLRDVTTYHYRVVGKNDNGQIVKGQDKTFTTVTPVPLATTDPPTRITSYSVLLNATINPYGGNYRFEYVDDARFQATGFANALSTPTRVPSQGGTTTVNEALRGVEPDTLYHSRVVVTNVSGTTYGADRTFWTPPTPVATYSFDEGSGDTLHDSAGHPNGVISGASWTSSGKYGSALDFDGVDDLVRIANTADLNLTNSFTVEAWVRPDALGGGAVLSKGKTINGQAGGFLLTTKFLGRNPGGVVTNAGSTAYVTNSSALKTEAWSHLAFSSDGTNLRLYIDGQTVATRSAIAAQSTDANFVIGHSEVLNTFFSGLIDEVRIYDQPLDRSQIQADSEMPVGLKQTPVAAYSFNEGSGSTVKDLVRGHDGTISGGATWNQSGKFGSALYFNGSSAMVRVPNAADLDLTDFFTLEAWVAPDSLGFFRPVLGKGEDTGSGSSGYLLLAQGSRKPTGYVASSGTTASVVGTSALSLTRWAHLAFSSDGGNLRFYLDGELQSATSAIAARATGADLVIGYNSLFNNYFNGLIDEVRIYDEPLSQEDIQADRDAGL